MDRKNLPEEQEDGGGEGYLGGVGVGRVVSAEGEGDDVDEKNGSHATEETKNPFCRNKIAGGHVGWTLRRVFEEHQSVVVVVVVVVGRCFLDNK